MFKIFRIIFAILAAIAAASTILLGILFGIVYLVIAASLTLFFFGICILFKQLQERQESVNNTPTVDNPTDNTTNLDETKANIEAEIVQLQQNSTNNLDTTDNLGQNLPIDTTTTNTTDTTQE